MNSKLPVQDVYSFRDFWLFLQVKYFAFKEALEVYHRFSEFLIYEKAFRKAYRFRSPYQICRTHLKENHAYGETPLLLYEKIAAECALTQKDVVLELGCGRGRGVFFLSYLVGCSVIGIDWIPFFVHTANAIPHKLPIAFLCEDMQTTDLSTASVIYLYGTCLSEGDVQALVRRFEKLSRQVKIVTVSYPLSEYSACFCTLKQLTGTFPWGEGEVFINIFI